MKPTGTPRAIDRRRVSPLLVIRVTLAAACVAGALVLVPAAVGREAGSLWTPVLAAAPQPQHGPAPAAQEHGATAEGAASHGAASPWNLVARLFNFAILAGVLVYFLRSPFSAFLAARGAAIRAELAKAGAVGRTAGEQLAEIDRRLAALPAELEALGARGIKEAAAEDARMRSATEAECARLVEHGRRQMEAEIRVAKRELAAHVADLAVGIALERIRETIRDEDHHRLVAAYVGRVGTALAAPPIASNGGRP